MHVKDKKSAKLQGGPLFYSCGVLYLSVWPSELRSFKGHKPILKRSKGGDQTETDFLTLQIGFRAPLKICGYYRNLPAYVLIGDMRSDCKDKR